MAWIDKLEKIMVQLRGKEGCPWDKEQDHESLKKYCLEEAYEVVEAIESKDDTALKDELGDLLLQVMFHAQLASERGAFDFNDIAQNISEKMLRRHPHVFEKDKALVSAMEVEEQWENIKQKEKKDKKLLDVCLALPALSKAQKVSKKAAKVGFDWQNIDQVYEKVEEELLELKEAQSKEHQQEELGDVLFAMVSLARHQGLDAEESLQAATKKFQKRFYQVEAKLKEKEVSFSEASFDQLNACWNEIKREA